MSLAQTPPQFEKLKPFSSRNFLSEKADLTDVETVKTFYNRLVEEAVSSPEEFEDWISSRSELEAALSQTGSVLYIRMTCQTDNEEYSRAYKDFVKNVQPVTKTYDHKLNEKFLQLLDKYPLDKEKYGIYIREIKTDVELYREENIKLSVEESLLCQEYQALSGSLTVDFQGEERTMPQMAKFLYETDRNLREEAWRAMTKRRLQEKDKFEEIFDKLMALRGQKAKNAGFDNYIDYRFKALHRFDYTPDDCRRYHESIEKALLPLRKKILEKRARDMKIERLRPWDTSVDPLGRPPLKPFDEVKDLVSGCQKVFKNINEEFGQQFKEMSEAGLLDLASRKGKAPGGYQCALDESRKPFIFMNAVGLDSDLRTLLHEGGHAFHALACSHHSLVDYRHGPMEFNEVASMAMELIADRHLSVFYNSEDETRSRINHLEDVIFVLIWVATIDAFQLWIYEHPEHSREERKNAWLEISARFSPGVIDWSGLDEERAYAWHRQLHIFEVPFYYIEYGIAQLGALQLWAISLDDYQKAVDLYKNATRLGGSRPLPEIYKACGIRFDFSLETIKPMIEKLGQELKKLNF